MYLFKWINRVSPELSNCVNLILIELKNHAADWLRQRLPLLSEVKIMKLAEVVAYDLLTHGKPMRFNLLRAIKWDLPKSDYIALGRYVMQQYGFTD